MKKLFCLIKLKNQKIKKEGDPWKSIHRSPIFLLFRAFFAHYFYLKYFSPRAVAHPSNHIESYGGSSQDNFFPERTRYSRYQ